MITSNCKWHTTVRCPNSTCIDIIQTVEDLIVFRRGGVAYSTFLKLNQKAAVYVATEICGCDLWQIKLWLEKAENGEEMEKIELMGNML
jgi:hypothetical protein